MEKIARRPVQLSVDIAFSFLSQGKGRQWGNWGDDLALARLSFRGCAINIDETSRFGSAITNTTILVSIDSLRDSFSRGRFREEKWIHEQAADSR